LNKNKIFPKAKRRAQTLCVGETIFLTLKEVVDTQNGLNMSEGSTLFQALHLGDLDEDGRIILKWILNNVG
jgi:hypothetical protein